MKTCRLTVLAGALSAAALAQVNGSMKGTLTCATPTKTLTVPAADSPDHMLNLAQYSCTWSAPVKIGDFSTSHDVLTIASEMRGDDSESHGYETINMTNGDRLSVRYSGISSVAKGIGKGAWRIASGQGRYRGIDGSGTFRSTLAKDGTLRIEFEGSYNLKEQLTGH